MDAGLVESERQRLHMCPTSAYRGRGSARAFDTPHPRYKSPNAREPAGYALCADVHALRRSQYCHLVVALVHVAMKRKVPGHLYWAGAALFGASSYSTWRYFTYHREAIEAVDSLQACPSGTAFDSLASKYDAAVGSEETWMGYGLLRSWLLAKAQ
ncbi:uncharacterized protein HaLaN_20871, partial [Haematococcus lacustris]